MIDRKTALAGLIVLALIFLLRLPAFWTPIVNVDESQFAGFADWLLHGGLPYVSSLDTKPLGIYWFFAAIFYLFGRNNMIAVHVVTALWVAATALFCYLIAKETYSRRAGFWAALFYAVFSAAYVPKFIATSITIVMMLPLAASIYCILIWERRQQGGWMFASGLLWGIACLFKYQAGINLLVAGAYLILARPILKKGSGIRIGELVLFVAGGAAVGALFALYLYSIGVWDDFVFWSIGGSNAYIEHGTNLTPFWKNLSVRGGSFVASTLLIWILAAAASIRMIRDDFIAGTEKERPVGRHLILIWLLLSIIPVCTGGKFYDHYFIQLLPQLCALGGGAAAASMARPRRALTWLIIAGMLIPSAGFFAARLASDRIYDALGEENPDEYRAIGEYIGERTGEGDTIFVWGFATPVYFFSNRLGASRFLWCDWLTGRVSGTPQAKDPSFKTLRLMTPGSWNVFFEDMEKNRPAYFVDTSPGNHHDYGKYPISGYPALSDFVRRNYELESSIDGADIYSRKRRN